jgi:hypothetical protein
MVKKKLKQYGLVGVGIMVAIGFSGVFSYSGLVNTNSQNQDRQEINATLPQENYAEESFDLSVQEQAYLAANNDVVLVNAVYENDSTVYSDLETLPGEMNNRVYVNLVDSSESALTSNYELDVPSALVIGGQPSQTQRGTIPYTLRGADPDRGSIKEVACGVMRDPGDLAATCFS